MDENEVNKQIQLLKYSNIVFANFNGYTQNPFSFPIADCPVIKSEKDFEIRLGLRDGINIPDKQPLKELVKNILDFLVNSGEIYKPKNYSKGISVILLPVNSRNKIEQGISYPNLFITGRQVFIDRDLIYLPINFKKLEKHYGRHAEITIPILAHELGEIIATTENPTLKSSKGNFHIKEHTADIIGEYLLRNYDNGKYSLLKLGKKQEEKLFRRKSDVPEADVTLSYSHPSRSLRNKLLEQLPYL